MAEPCEAAGCRAIASTRVRVHRPHAETVWVCDEHTPIVLLATEWRPEVVGGFRPAPAGPTGRAPSPAPAPKAQPAPALPPSPPQAQEAPMPAMTMQLQQVQTQEPAVCRWPGCDGTPTSPNAPLCSRDLSRSVALGLRIHLVGEVGTDADYDAAAQAWEARQAAPRAVTVRMDVEEPAADDQVPAPVASAMEQAIGLLVECIGLAPIQPTLSGARAVVELVADWTAKRRLGLPLPGLDLAEQPGLLRALQAEQARGDNLGAALARTSEQLNEARRQVAELQAQVPLAPPTPIGEARAFRWVAENDGGWVCAAVGWEFGIDATPERSAPWTLYVETPGNCIMVGCLSREDAVRAAAGLMAAQGVTLSTELPEHAGDALEVA